MNCRDLVQPSINVIARECCLRTVTSEPKRTVPAIWRLVTCLIISDALGAVQGHTRQGDTMGFLDRLSSLLGLRKRECNVLGADQRYLYKRREKLKWIMYT